MAIAIADIKKESPLLWPPAKIILMPFPYRNFDKIVDGKGGQDEISTRSKEETLTITFCEPVFKPKKHEFL
jgi:hypothetical protein